MLLSYLKKMVMCILLVMTSGIALAVQIHADSNEMDTIGRPFGNIVYIPEYTGQKDRYCEECLKNDPEVLISKPNKKKQPEVMKTVMADKPNSEGLLIEANLEMEDGSMKTPVQCTNKEGVLRCEW